ncbi:MAG: ribosomal-processing cysteine protease Prp [Clostridia bacterium]|jgi:hypothetical protein|nr:ribosomal-processing cysteine protease Prp [Clostridia bacterium]MDD3231749.1 ribosomal-processing cysteine protease Prp [Clostridia bacterium]MDD3862352.1 ribosomal-processing cysteine protease Prp [Clostridia bacterium]MDD4408294.1 ribosomal-processing cysteine protease Prp [Clostridia bacterium]
MTTIKIFKQKKMIISIECSGHSGYAEKGSDIVCSAISAIIGTCYLGLKNVVKAEFKHSQDDEKGYFLIKINENLDTILMEKAQIILQTTVLSLTELSKDYKKFVTIKLIIE